MKKQLLYLMMLGMFISATVIAQTNLLENPSFETPSEGKYRGDCAGGLCFNGNVPGWFLEAGCTDTGIESLSNTKWVPDGARAAYAYDMDGATCQILSGVIDATNRKYTLTYWGRMAWSNASAATPDELYYVTYYYSFAADADTATKVKLDTLAFLDEAYSNLMENGSYDSTYYEFTHTYTVPSSETGKKLVIGFDLIAKNETVDFSSAWVQFDNFSLTVEAAPVGINETVKSEIKVFPNPSNNSVTFANLEGLNTIEIFNSIGAKIQTVDVTNSQIILSGLQSGIYFARFNNQSLKFIVK